ncbi:MAG TPA: ABC-2 family transporter protein [Candidatus Obscuribacterales bacterium]
MFRKLLKYLRLARAYVSLNWRIHWQYKAAFCSQALAMALNDLAWVSFWALFFTAFPVVKGWTAKEVVTLWALAAAGFGLAHAICGNALLLPQIVTRGQIDVWMLYPRAVLPHLLLGKMSATACGDAIFGYAVYIFFVRPDAPHLLLFALLTIAIAILFVGFSVLAGSLAFYVGNSETLSEQWFFSMITFSTYPNSLFDGWIKIVLFTLIPAGFVSALPVEALRNLSLTDALLTFAGALAVLSVGSAAFYIGLSRYESGNLIEMRG